MKSSDCSAHIGARAEKAALKTDAKTLEEQNALELKTLQLQMEIQQRQLKLLQRKREIKLYHINPHTNPTRVVYYGS